ARRRPHVGDGSTLQKGYVDLRHVGATWELTMAPSSVSYHARAGEPIEYRERTVRRRQNWLQFPVSGLSGDDALACTDSLDLCSPCRCSGTSVAAAPSAAAWPHRSRRLPRARLCSEPEWERAMRGADGRAFPHGDRLARDDANIDITYGQTEGGFGPDEVGSH